MLFAQLCQCDWTDYRTGIARLQAQLKAQMNASASNSQPMSLPPALPLPLPLPLPRALVSCLSLSSSLQLLMAKRHALEVKAGLILDEKNMIYKPKLSENRLKIGYLVNTLSEESTSSVSSYEVCVFKHVAAGKRHLRDIVLFMVFSLLCVLRN